MVSSKPVLQFLNQFSSLRTRMRSISSFTTSLTKIHRNAYCRTYPTLLVFPDGSTTTIRYHEPRQIITLPVDMKALSDDERRIRMEKRRPRSKVQNIEMPKINFDPKKYVNLIKKK